jgi:hypothetical protein
MRQTLLLLILLLPALGILNAVWFGSELARFAREVLRLESSADVERFKEVVARQMYAALVQIVILAAPPILFFVGIVRRELFPADVLAIIVPAGVVIAVAALYKKVEQRVRAIPAADPELERQRDAVIHTWLKKPLPDW